MLCFYLRDKKQPNTQKLVILFCFVVLLVTLSGASFDNRDRNFRVVAGITGQIIAWVSFILLAWNYRKKHMATTILLLAYANLQLPAGLIGKQGFGVDLVLLLASKLSLIGAMYHTLGVRDAKP